ncbi:hypothetical protein IJG90_00590 [Candidatus Saccharibacteria bacterium]|nr:hypothetical protein [Candidatus Saccharibacteria bacterium]
MSEIMVPKMRVRRRDYRKVVLISVAVFAMVFLFTFLTAKFKLSDETEAANLANFDAGYIISDWQMGNYNSMTEAEIQKFLTSKNSCANTDYDYYLRLSASSSYKWHFKDGHFVCLSEELFGDGEVIGSGETAAHIIWQTAQDYKINPQVLIVLLQKETGLITDPIPNDWDYRRATGYGCPDTAPCSSEYYGFQNQVRKAASLFRTVLDGGWTNYPLGENYVQYNPNADCGGTVVNIRSLATSALYRYTPYQPNAAALAAGTGYGDYCSAYGNRNFYVYFEDWFSGITADYQIVREWQNMTNPRKMTSVVETMKINPSDNSIYTDGLINKGETLYYTSKITIVLNGTAEACLRTAEDTEKGLERCVIMSRLADYKEPDIVIEDIDPVVMQIRRDTAKIDLRTGAKVQLLKMNDYSQGISFSGKVVVDGKEYYQTNYDHIHGNNYFVPSEDLSVLPFVNFLHPRNMQVIRESAFVDLILGGTCRNIEVGYVSKFIKKVLYDGEWYYQSEEDAGEANTCVILAKNVGEYESSNLPGTKVQSSFRDFLYPRELRASVSTYKINAETGASCNDYVKIGNVYKYTTKLVVGNKVYYRTEQDTSNNSPCVVDSINLEEI